MYTCVHCSIIHGDQDLETMGVPFDRGLDKDVVNTYNEILLDFKKNEILPFATTWMYLGNITLNEISQMEKVKSHMISLPCEI